MTRVLTVLSCVLACAIPCNLQAQQHHIYYKDIRSLQVVANQSWQDLPIMELKSGKIDIDFDDLTHTYRRMTYKLEHCEADWQPSTGLFDSDIAEGFMTGNTIDNVQESTLTNTPYTHYHLEIPNENWKPKISGNYRLTVYDDNEPNQPLLSACFMITESAGQSMGVNLNITTHTDKTINDAHQQVEMRLNYGNFTVIDPARQIKTVVMQNRNWLDARWNVRPQYILNDGLRWIHCHDYIFSGGNEYRKFEILSTDVASMGIDRMTWDGHDYHAYPFPTAPQTNYIYEEDADGAFLIRNSDNTEINTTSDYIKTHFSLNVPIQFKGHVYLNGDWTYGHLLPEYEMVYDTECQSYQAMIPLKSGYYNYQFLATDEWGNLIPFENGHYQTENSYQALVYYRPQGGRTDKLVGYANVKFHAR